MPFQLNPRPLIQCVSQLRALWGAFVHYEYQELDFHHVILI